MKKLRAAQSRVLRVLDSRKGATPAQVADAVDSRPGPMTRCLWAMDEMGLVKSSGNDEKGYRFTRTALGAKVLRAGGFD